MLIWKNSILTHIVKKLQASYCLSKKASRFFFKFFFFLIFNTFSVIDLTFKLWVSRSTKIKKLWTFYCIFSPKIWVKKIKILHFSFWDFEERLDKNFQNNLWILKSVLYPNHLKKILSHIGNNYKPFNFWKTAWPKKHQAKKSFHDF